MPLVNSNSKVAFSENVRREMSEGGKPQKQAVAIAYSVKRKASHLNKRGIISDKQKAKLND